MSFRDWKYNPLTLAGRVFNRQGNLSAPHEAQQQQYRDTIEHLQGLADAIPEAALVLDKGEAITWFNTPAKQLLNLDGPLDCGQKITQLIQAPEFADWLAMQDEIPGKLYIPCPVDDDIPLQISVTRFGKNQRLLILRDIGDMEKLDRIRRDLIANISHELRTPLTVLLGYLELLRDSPRNLDKKTAKSMFKQAKQMHALLEDLLELSRLQDTKLKTHADTVNMTNMLTQLKEQAEEYSKGDHELIFEIEPDIDLNGTESDLKSAFQNLLINAVNYTPSGGSIKVSWQSEDEGLVLTVRDSGIGIPKKDIPRITERFYRVGSDRARQTGGTGLGLAIVKHVLNLHKASLEISSEIGKGSEFRCVFPHTPEV